MAMALALPARAASDNATGDAAPDGSAFDASLDGRVVVKRADEPAPSFAREPTGVSASIDMADVVGQEAAKRALMVAAAGGHHVLMTGPPGSGKTMLARRVPTILPPLSSARAMETTMIYSIMGMLHHASAHGGLVTQPPFRAPHHTASYAGLIGGNANPRPGEITLAHNGVLFLDELPEFSRQALETLREPLEEGHIAISRAKSSVTYPARFMLIAAMNPCLCGYHGSPLKQCRCSPLQIENYVGKISGPLLARIAVRFTVRPVDVEAWNGVDRGGRMTSAEMRDRVSRARAIQQERFVNVDGIDCNARIPEKMFRRLCAMDRGAEAAFVLAQKNQLVSARGRAHIVRVARSIADIEASERIAALHMAEALGYRGRG
jgi:magnesium chelatase family protein